MALPNITDQARLNPPFASVVTGRRPMIQWHNTYSGARRSALGYQNTRSGDPARGEEQYANYTNKSVGIATLNADGSVEYVDQWVANQKIEWRR